MNEKDYIAANTLLRDLLNQFLSVDESAWYQEKLAGVRAAEADRQVFLSISLAARNIGRRTLDLDDSSRTAADEIHPGWDLSTWTTEQLVRTSLLLESTRDPEVLFRRLELMFRTGDVVELETLYKALPLYLESHRYVDRATEGIRTNMKNVFEAVAHHNPFPAEHLDEGAWNQMVLKALFVDTSLAPIQGLDRRANPALKNMLCDYAHERWAAGRSVSPELWRCVGPFADDAACADLERVLGSDDTTEQLAAVLALRAGSGPRTMSLLSGAPASAIAAADNGADWASIAAHRGV